MRVYLPRAQRLKVIATGEFARVDAVRRARIYADELAREPDRFAMLARSSMGPELAQGGCLAGARAVWSQWPGYLDEPPGKRTTEWLAEQAIPLDVIHASGHASIRDLRRVADAFAGARLVPIHTAHPSSSPTRSDAPRFTPTENGGPYDRETADPARRARSALP